MTHSLRVLLDAMTSPDPTIRDGWAYEELAEGITSGQFASSVDLIRRTALVHLRAEQVQARTFAPLILTWLVAAGDRDRDAFESVSAWYLAETDTRGYDEQLGWLHAVAHGADYLGECARAGIASGSEVLPLLARRVIAPGGVWRDQEDARIAHAAVLALATCDAAQATGWLMLISEALDQFENSAATGRPPAWLHNVYATCATLYVTLVERAGDDSSSPAGDVPAALAGVMSTMTPWLLAREA